MSWVRERWALIRTFTNGETVSWGGASREELRSTARDLRAGKAQTSTMWEPKDIRIERQAYCKDTDKWVAHEITDYWEC